VSEQTRKQGVSRRGFLLGGAGAATVVAGASLGRRGSTATNLSDARLAVAGVPDVHLAATDGWASMPSANQPDLKPFWPDPLAPDGKNLYIFGFRNVTGLTDSQVALQRGHAQISAPQLAFKQDQDYRVKLSNLGLSVRPDLVDGHTIHWHGFVNAIPLFDGVPELSISVPIGRSFTYFYRPHDPGTYMYHCHFEDVEHVQMGMTGLLFVSPKQNGSPFTVGGKTFTKFVYNDGDGSTGYDREFGLFLTEIFAEGHYRDAHIQTTDWTDFKASFWCINGRSYPDTVQPNGPYDTALGYQTGLAPGSPATGSTVPDALQYQPQSALVRANAGDRVLLRFANLGYQNHAMSMDNVPMRVVGKDALLLRNGSVGSYRYNYIDTNSVEIGPGESSDALFTAPPFTGGTGTSGHGYDTYLLYDRNLAYADNAGDPASPGGMLTEVRVFPAGTLPAQTQPNA
jgi:FtsP/CotA-like multicopper oxidase with cupredoxin domain